MVQNDAKITMDDDRQSETASQYRSGQSVKRGGGCSVKINGKVIDQSKIVDDTKSTIKQ